MENHGEQLNEGVDSRVVTLFPARKSEKLGADVERINPYGFYELGEHLRILASHPDGCAPSDMIVDLWKAMHSARKLANEANPIPLGIAQASIRAVSESLARIESHFYGDDGKGGREFKWPTENYPPVPAWYMSTYRSNLEKFETVFSAEMAETAAYYVPRRGIFWTPALVDTADETFPASIAARIPDKTKVDWRAAGRCLAFNLLTASGFHVARAVEGTLESYYQLFTKQPGKTQHGWHDYIKELEPLAKDTGPTTKTLTGLKQMKDNYRNPLAHPRVVLDEADARMLFADGESLVIAMAGEMQANAPAVPVLSVSTIATGGGLTP